MERKNFFDRFLLCCWKGLVLVCESVLAIVALVFNAISAFFSLLFKLPPLSGFAESSFAKQCARVAKSAIFSSSARWFRNAGRAFNEKMEASSLFRRVVFLVLLCLVVLIVYPPSHWGPWYRYQTGVASYYSTGFWFKKTASGERFIPLFMTAAHKTLPLGTTVKVVNVATGSCVYVRINDRGPFVKGRIIDLSSFAARRLGIYEKGTGKVVIYTKRPMTPR